jgi:hypothetical protein
MIDLDWRYLTLYMMSFDRSDDWTCMKLPFLEMSRQV